MSDWLLFLGSWILAFADADYQSAYWDAVARQNAYYGLLFSRIEND